MSILSIQDNLVKEETETRRNQSNKIPADWLELSNSNNLEWLVLDNNCILIIITDYYKLISS